MWKHISFFHITHQYAFHFGVMSLRVGLSRQGYLCRSGGLYDSTRYKIKTDYTTSRRIWCSVFRYMQAYRTLNWRPRIDFMHLSPQNYVGLHHTRIVRGPAWKWLFQFFKTNNQLKVLIRCFTLHTRIDLVFQEQLSQLTTETRPIFSIIGTSASDACNIHRIKCSE